MFEQLKNLVFGLHEYDKTKYEVRFELIGEIVDNLLIKKIEDFEIIEDVTYKIKDQLRVKSSNLNKVINDSSKNLKKRYVEEILAKLSKIKYDFLKKAFNIEEFPETSSKIEEEIKSENITEPIIEKFEKNITKENKQKITKELDLTIQENDKYKVILENGKVPHILINFKTEIDFKVIKHYLITFFDTYYPEGTNIIVEKNIALIIPRTNGDNLIELPQKESDKLDEAYESLHSKLNKTEKIDDNKEEYINVEKLNNHTKPTSKKKDAGLDDLLMGEVKKKEHITHTPEEDKEEKPKIIKSEPIEIEKDIKIKDSDKKSIEIIKEEKEIEKPSVEIKKENSKKKVKKIDIEDIKKEEENLRQENNQKLKEEITPIPSIEQIDRPNLIYQDDKIITYLESNTKVLGEIIIEPKFGKLGDLNEADLSYISIFSKIFSSTLFELLEAHGTNLLWDYNSNKLRIIPRFQEDKLDLDWKPQSMNDATLDDIRNKLSEKLSQGLGQQSPNNNIEKVEGEIVHSPNNRVATPKEENLEEKAKYILESLRRIP